MTQVRRVVTGHDAAGNAKVLIDETTDVVERTPGGRIGAKVFWTTESFPVDNTGDLDDAQLSERSRRRCPTGRSSASSSSCREIQRADTEQTRSTTRSCSRAKSTWSWTART